MYQIIRLELNRDGEIVARRALQPLFELWEDAMALSEFDATRCGDDYGYDEEHEGWWVFGAGRSYRFVVEQVVATDIAA